MLCEVYDNIFSRDFIVELDNVIKNLPVETANISGAMHTKDRGVVGNHRLFGLCIFNRTGLNRITHLHEKSSIFFDALEIIEKSLKRKLYVEGIHLNLQHSGCNGSSHIDADSPHEKTIMLMSTCYWESDWGGQFQLTNEDGTAIVEEHEYIPGRLLVIPSNHPHRGLGPKVEYPYVYRTTIVFRTKPLAF
jgi:hypothetical protein